MEVITIVVWHSFQVTLYGKQKVPCLLYFSRVEEPVVDSSNHTTQSLPAGSLTIQPSPAGFQVFVSTLSF